MSFEIKFNYTFDQSGFFTPERQEILEYAGKIWSSYIEDDFTAIPAEEILSFPIDNTQRDVILNEPIEDLTIFVSSVELDSEFFTLGEGGFHGDFAIGSDRAQRLNGDDFEPWLGTIEFNVNAVDRFFFDSTPYTVGDIPSNKQDFLSLSLHEIGHILGIGIAPAFERQVSDGKFTGSTAVALNGGEAIALDEDLDHIENNFSLDEDSDALLDKSFIFGERNLPTNLDLAILDDIGYDITPYDRTQVHRFYRYDQGFHFYTANSNEQEVIRDLRAAGELPYDYENVAYDVLAQDKDILTGEQVEGAVPVYRFFNQVTGAHLYTMDENEKDFIRDNLSAFSFENVAYYAFESEPTDIETIPLYRMLNTQTNTHLFTTDANEFKVLSETQPQFQIEGDNGGITFHVLESL